VINEVKKEFRTDPVMLSVIENALFGISKEMTLTVLHTSRSPILSVTLDFGCGITNANGELVALSVGVAFHSTGLDYAVRGIKEYFGDELYPGDVIMCNDPHKPFYACGHLGDFCTVAPVFYKDELVFWCVERGHQADTGGITPGATTAEATDIRMEGLRMSPVKLYEAGKFRRDVFDLILHQLRMPAVIAGDTHAAIGSVRTGERRLLRLIDKFGLETVKNATEDILDYSEMLMRERISNLPDGSYSAERWSDGDMQGGPYKLKVTVIVEGDSITVDWTGSDPQSKGPCNGTLSTTHAKTFIGLLPTIAKGLPNNNGIIRPVKIIAPEGSIVNAQAPAPTSLGTGHPGNEMTNCVFGAISQIAPEYAMGDWDRSQCSIVVGGDPRTGAMFSSVEQHTSGGAGAQSECDGWSHLGVSGALGGVMAEEVEMAETVYPYFMLHSSFIKDSGGAGKWRGGLGIEVCWQSEADWGMMTPWGDGHFTPTYGARGGRAPQPPYDYSQIYLNKQDGATVDVKRRALYQFDAGDIYHHVASGGGGVGDPLERDVEDVKRDIMNEFISLESAGREYGVIFKQDKWPYDINYEATEKLRREKKEHPVDYKAIEEERKETRFQELREGTWLNPPAGGPEDEYRTEDPLK